MTYVTLSSNQFTVFEEGVFKEMLQQMVSVKPPIGLVQIGGSIFLRIRHLRHLEIFNWHFIIEFRLVHLRLRHRLAHSRQSSSPSRRLLGQMVVVTDLDPTPTPQRAPVGRVAAALGRPQGQVALFHHTSSHPVLILSLIGSSPGNQSHYVH